METKKQFGNLSEFAKRDVELFRSSDQNETAIYFTDVEHNDRETAKAYFEILRFGLDGGDHQLYVRFPNTDYFVEMIGGGFGSGRGDMKQADGKNVWEDKHKAPFRIYSHNKNLIFIIGRTDWTPEFNFMGKVASYDKGNPFNHPYPDETFVNFKEIEKALSMKYLKIPESIRKIEYCYKTKDETPKYFVVDPKNMQRRLGSSTKPDTNHHDNTEKIATKTKKDLDTNQITIADSVELFESGELVWWDVHCRMLTKNDHKYNLYFSEWEDPDDELSTLGKFLMETDNYGSFWLSVEYKDGTEKMFQLCDNTTFEPL